MSGESVAVDDEGYIFEEDILASQFPEWERDDDIASESNCAEISEKPVIDTSEFAPLFSDPLVTDGACIEDIAEVSLGDDTGRPDIELIGQARRDFRRIRFENETLDFEIFLRHEIRDTLLGYINHFPRNVASENLRIAHIGRFDQDCPESTKWIVDSAFFNLSEINHDLC